MNRVLLCAVESGLVHEDVKKLRDGLEKMRAEMFTAKPEDPIK